MSIDRSIKVSLSQINDKRTARAVQQAFDRSGGVGVITPLGTNQATGAKLLYAVNEVVGADGTLAAVLPTPTKDDHGIWVINVTAAVLPIYPDVGGQINGLGADAVYNLAASQAAFFAPGATPGQWYTGIVGASSAQIAYLTGSVAGTATASKALVVDANKAVDVLRTASLMLGASGSEVAVGSTAAELNTLAAANTVLATEAAAGITGGVGTVYKSSVQKLGGIFKSSILIDLTGLGSSTTDLDIIGQGVSAAHIGRITAARSGTILSGMMTCLEVPVGGIADVDLYSANEATGKFDDGVAALTETAIVTSGGAWTLGLTKAITGIPPANDYLYLCGGAGGTAAAYTAGKFLIEFDGYTA